MQKYHFLLVKISKNTGSAQLWKKRRQLFQGRRRQEERYGEEGR